MKQWYFIIDVAKCMDCNNCFIACKDEHENNDWPGYTAPQPRHEQRWITIERRERGQFPLIDVSYLPTPCQHCADAPCVKNSNGAIYRRDDGIVLVDQEKARGQKQLAALCPYGAMYWNEGEQIIQKCTMCAHLLDSGWAQPRCSQACFTGALRVVQMEESELKVRIAEEGLEHLHPKRGTMPHVYYRNLHLFTSDFIAGSVAAREGGRVDCLEGIRVNLFCDTKKLKETLSDTFGDFKFDNILKDSGRYSLEFEGEGYLPQRVIVEELAESINLGTISLTPAE